MTIEEQVYQLKTVRKLSWGDICRRLGIDEPTAKAYYNTAVKSTLYVKNSPVFMNEEVDLPEYRELYTIEETEPTTIDDDSALIISDTHCPHQNTDLLRKAVGITHTYFKHVNKVIHAGDLLDNEAFSRHPKTNPNLPPQEFSLDAAGNIIQFLTDNFDVTYMVSGNHDEWISRKLDAPFTHKHVVNACVGNRYLNGQLIVSNFDYIYLGDDWVIGHPSHYSGQGGKTPADIADLEQRNVVTGHNHRYGIQTSKSGRYIGIDLGHMTDPSSHYYMQRRLTKFAKWNGGFVVISKGYAYAFPDGFTDWEAWGV